MFKKTTMDITKLIIEELTKLNDSLNNLLVFLCNCCLSPAAARILSCGVVNNNKGMHAKLLKT